jgi:hypothetical protein
MPDTFPVVFATCAGTSSKLAALTFTRAEMSSNKAKNPDAILNSLLLYFRLKFEHLPFLPAAVAQGAFVSFYSRKGKSMRKVIQVQVSDTTILKRVLLPAPQKKDSTATSPCLSRLDSLH